LEPCVDLGHSTYVVSSSETVRDFLDTWIDAVEPEPELASTA